MIDLADLRNLVAAHGRCVRIVTARIQGSTPREPGAAMIVWATGQQGTIGGGTLEHEATQEALQWLKNTPQADWKPRVTHHPLGPALGQCCGGAVTLLSEVFDEASVAKLEAGSERFSHKAYVKRVQGSSELPLALRRQLARQRAQGALVSPILQDGWWIEPIEPPKRSVWIWGAGHVGRAMVDVFAPLPNLALTWVDTDAGRFPANIPENIDRLIAKDPALLLPHAPKDAQHLIVTYSHALDFTLCHGLLSHGFEFAGLIGSKTKWARFGKRLQALGHAPEQILRITCPIGDPALGKHPQAIAIGVAAKLLNTHVGAKNIPTSQRSETA